MRIRRYEPDDLSQITALFYDTVHAVNAADYSPEQLDAWCTDCDFVFHLAGVNRPQNNEEFMQGNRCV